MSARSQELRAEKYKLDVRAQEIHQKTVDEKRDITSEEKEEWDRLFDQMKDLRTQYEEIEDRERQLGEETARFDERRDLIKERPTEEGRNSDPDDPKEFENRHAAYFDDLMRHGESGLSDESREFRSSPEYAEFRATGQQLVGTAGKGGTLAPTDFNAEIEAQLLAFGGLRSGGATIVNTSHGRNIDYPTYDDTGNVSAIVAEASTFGSTHVPISKFTLESVKHGVLIQVSDELLTDSLVPVNNWLPQAMGVRFARGTEAQYATRSSTESVGPHGIITGSSGALDVANNALTADNLIDLIHLVDPAYRANARWMFNDATEKSIRLLKWGSTAVGSREYVWQPSFQAGAPDRLLGFPVSRNYSFQSFGTSGNKPIAFGDMSSYYIRDVAGGVAIRRLEERYAEKGLVGFLGFMRTDGRPGFATTVPARKPVRFIIQAT